MAHRGQWSEHEARGVLSAWRKSGQSLDRFAKERGLPIARSTMNDLRLRRQRAGPIRDQLHEWLLHQKKRRLDELLSGPWSRAQVDARSPIADRTVRLR